MWKEPKSAENSVDLPQAKMELLQSLLELAGAPLIIIEKKELVELLVKYHSIFVP